MMAKAKTTAKTAGADKKKPAKAKAKTATKSAAKKPAQKAKTKAKSKKAANKGYVALAKLAEHPLVIDLIAIGATAAVAALAGRAQAGKTSGAKTKSSVKAAGQAAAVAVGKRLMTEFNAVKDVSAAAKKKKA